MAEPQTGGVTSKDDPANVPHDVFATSGSQPVRDRTADPSKGTPVTRFFTKEGTPVEPSSLPPAKDVVDYATAGPSADSRDDVVAAVEYIDESGAPVTHDSLKAKQEADTSGAAKKSK